MSKYKLLALDVDGTLLNPQGEITPRVHHAICQAVDAGCLVTLATGRRLRPARRFAGQLGLKLPLILYSGGIIYDTATEKALYHQPIPKEFLKKTIDLLLPDFGVCLLQSPLQGEYIWFGPTEYDNPYQRDYATNPARADLVRRCDFRDLYRIEDVLTIASLGLSSNLEPLVKILQANLDCNIYSYSLSDSTINGLYGLDLLPVNNTKANALKWLASHFGLTMSETMVVGDGPNDVEMFEAAGLSVAMGNAIDKVKALADVVVKPNSEDGVAEAIERFILGGS